MTWWCGSIKQFGQEEDRAGESGHVAGLGSVYQSHIAHGHTHTLNPSNVNTTSKRMTMTTTRSQVGPGLVGTL